MDFYKDKLRKLRETGCLRCLPEVVHEGGYIRKDGKRLVNLSSNDYLALAADRTLRNGFLKRLLAGDLPFSASSSRLLTGNYAVASELEALLACRYGREAALLFNSGYHANLGILPAVSDKRTLIVADKLVHASLIDGIRLSGAAFVRYRHNDPDHAERILQKERGRYDRYILVTESIFSMDGDVADLRRLAALKRTYPGVRLYVDEAHAVGVRGPQGLGVAEETGTIEAVDFLVGTFGKALASVGAYVICSAAVKEYLVNTVRPLIFSTALPPVNWAWSYYIFDRLPDFSDARIRLAARSEQLRRALGGSDARDVPDIPDAYGAASGFAPGSSHILPYVLGGNDRCIRRAEALQEAGFYVLPVRPPTVPEGTSRLRFSLTAAVTEGEIDRLAACLV